jgi:Mg2+ and Co2+ transporter CorA
LLTVFSAFMLPLTLITWFYGMNTEPLPLSPHNTIDYVFWWMFLTIAVMAAISIYLRKIGKL